MHRHFPISPLAIAFAASVAVHLAVLPLTFGALTWNDAQPPQSLDLEVSKLTAPATADAGQSFTAKLTVQNMGTLDAPPRRDRLLLSRDRLVDVEDIELASAGRQTLAAGRETSYDIKGSLPNDLDGPYVLIAVASAAGDTNPRNNQRSASIFIDGPQQPELVIDELDAPARAIIGSSVLLDFTVTNRGQGWTSRAWTDRVYLSTDAQLDESDLPLRTFQRERHLGPDQQHAYQRIEIEIPAAKPGRYHLITVADDGQVLDQPSFTRGLAVSPIELALSKKPDLVVTEIDPSNPIVPGRESRTRYTVANHGVVETATDAAWTDHVYLSRDRTINQDDLYLGSAASKRSLGIGEQYTWEDHRFTLPEDVEPGQWYLAVVADGGGTVDEGAFELNNAWAVPITVISQAEADEEPPLGEPEEEDRLTVAWIAHESLVEHMARKRSTIQPAIQSQAEPVPNAPSIPDPLPPSQAGVARAPAGNPDAAQPQTDSQDQSSARPQPSVPDPSQSDLSPRPQDPNTPAPEQVDGLIGPDGTMPEQREGLDTPQPPTDETKPNPTPDERDTSRENLGEREVDSKPNPAAPETDKQTESQTPSELDEQTDGQNPEVTDSPTPSEKMPPTESDTQTENDTTDPSKADSEGDSQDESNPTETTDTPQEQDTEQNPGEDSEPSKQNPEQTPTRREREDAEADETDINEPLRYQEGGVLVGRGIKIKTRRLRPPGAGTRFTTVPADASIQIVFNNKGQIVDAKILKSTGYRDWDSLILESLYRWTAEGERIDTANPHVVITMEYKFGLLSGQ